MWDSDYKKELKALNRELLLQFLELTDALVERPSQSARQVEAMTLILRNIHHLLNSLRPHQVALLLFKLHSVSPWIAPLLQENKRLHDPGLNAGDVMVGCSGKSYIDTYAGVTDSTAQGSSNGDSQVRSCLVSSYLDMHNCSIPFLYVWKAVICYPCVRQPCTKTCRSVFLCSINVGSPHMFGLIFLFVNKRCLHQNPTLCN